MRKPYAAAGRDGRAGMQHLDLDSARSGESARRLKRRAHGSAIVRSTGAAPPRRCPHRRAPPADRRRGRARPRARSARRQRGRPQRRGRRHAEEGRHAQAARHERHLQPRHRERLLHRLEPARAHVRAPARVVSQCAGLPRLDQDRSRHRDDGAHQGQRHQRRRQDLHVPPAPRRDVEHLARARRHRRGLRAGVQDALQPGGAERRTGLLHEHDRRHEGLLRRVREGQGDGPGDRRVRQGASAARRRRLGSRRRSCSSS